MRIVTWNVNSLTARLPRVTGWVEANAPDVLCLQETKQPDDKFPADVFTALGYESIHHGEGLRRLAPGATEVATVVMDGSGYIPCERCGDPSGTDRETYERVKPEHIFCSECRTAGIE